MKKIIMVGLIGLFCAVGAQAQLYQSTVSGNWTNSATWNLGIDYPGAAGLTNEVWVINGATVTNNSALPGTISSIATWGNSQLVLEDGADLQPFGNVQVNGNHILTVKAGASLSVGGYLMVGNVTGNTGTVIVDGGTVNAFAVFLGEATGASCVSTLQVTNGLLQSPITLIFAGAAGSVAQASITGGTAIFPSIAFNAANASNPETLTMDGGELILTGEPNGSLLAGGFGLPATSELFFESGAIIWQGVNTVAEFNTFATTFNGWVDSGNITSATFTPAELKGLLQFLEGSAVLSLAPRVFPVIDAPFVNLIANGDFKLTANEDNTLNPGPAFNVNGTFGDYSGQQNRTADVVDWAPFYADPDGLAPAVGTPHLVDGNGELDGTWYLDTLIDTNQHFMLLNSSMNYRNGMKQEDILNGVTIDSGKTYTLSVDAVYNDMVAGTDYSTSPLTVALTDGSGVAVTNPANAIAGSLLTGDVALWNGVQSVELSGADLLAAGQVNVIFDLECSFVIPGFPGGTPDPNDLAVTAQARVYSVSLGIVYVEQLGDLNKDGQVTQADVTLANSYLDGSIDGFDDAATRQAALVADGKTGPEALTYLNLTSFDIDGNGTFDAADVTALQALVPPLVILSAVLDGSSMSVEVGGMTIGTGYYLMKDTDLVSAPSFDVIADSITAASEIESLTDTNAVDGQAFYKIMQQ